MKLVLVNESGSTDITQLVQKVAWSGEYSQVARKLDFSIVSSATDNSIPVINISVGNAINFYYENILIFSGYVFTVDKGYQDNIMNVLAYDGGIYLLKNQGAYNFKNITAESITAKICNDFGVPLGILETTGITQNFVAIGDTLYDIIMKAYTKAAESNGKKYLAVMMNNKLNIIERGTLVLGYALKNDSDLINSHYSQSLESMVNQVLIVDDKGDESSGTVVGTVNNSDWIKSFGVFQKIYKKEDNVDANTAAKNLLNDIDKKGTVEAIGRIDCITGYGIGIEDDYTGLVGVFNIDSDNHTWENGVHTMSLNINMDALMDSKTYKEKQAAAKKPSTSSSDTIQWNF